MTDWAARELTPAQLEYAALDAAVTPKLMEKVLESVEGYISVDRLLQQESIEDGHSQQSDETKLHGPVICRWDGDDALVKEIVSYRFLSLPESSDGSTIGEFQAKQIVGPSWIATSMWTAIENPPAPHVVPSS